MVVVLSLQSVELILKNISFAVMDFLLSALDMITLMLFDIHVLAGSLVVHLVGQILGLLLLGLLPLIVLIEGAVTTLGQLSIVESCELEFAPRRHIGVLLDEEDFK